MVFDVDVAGYRILFVLGKCSLDECAGIAFFMVLRFRRDLVLPPGSPVTRDF